MKSLKNKFFIGLTAMAMTVATGVYAQGMHGDHVPAPEKIAKMQEKMQARMQKHQMHLHDQLKISAAQEPAWKAFTQAMTPETRAFPEHTATPALSSPERMEKMLQHAKDRLTVMQTHLDALKTFYAVLTPEQQKIFDESHQKMMHRRMQHHFAGMGK